MRKIFLSFLLILSTNLFAEDTVKVLVGTQTYLCEITNQLNCKAVNQVQKAEIQLKKNAGNVTIEDKETGFLAKPYEVKDYADKIIWLLENQEKRIEMGKALPCTYHLPPQAR